MAQLEIAVTALDDARRAVEGGAHSLELLRDLPNGGLTPDPALVSSVLAAVPIPAHVIIRPHARGFVYDETDIAQILRDAVQFAKMGAASIVFAAVTSDNALDIPLIIRVAQAVAPTPVTVHRALDGCADPDAALRTLVGVVPRVLTSGPAPNAWEGRDTTARWVRDYGQHFEFVLSGGITVEQMPELVKTTRAHVFHLGSAARINDAVDINRVRQLRALVR